MSWNSNAEVLYCNSSYPYNTTESFMEYVEGLTYDHVNFIFDGATHVQENVYPSLSTSVYKSWSSDPGNNSDYSHGHLYVFDDHQPRSDEYRRFADSPLTMATPLSPDISANWVGTQNATSFYDNSVQCPRRHRNGNDYQVLWEDSLDPDNMTYEELLELGETVGTQSRGLSQELISLLPVTKYKRWLFSRKKSRKERCVICQMEYKRGERQITLPCRHVYHASCGSKWLSINKACPICYTEVFGGASKRPG